MPNVQDMVRFAVREAFTPDIVKKFQLDEDLPKEFTEAAKLTGLSEDWSKMFWRAHWELPSIQQGYEMYHRKIISLDELKLLLKTQDVMPFWRDKLIQIAHVVPTRVDARRMYAHGIYDENDLIALYRKLGYAAVDAVSMAKLAVAMATEDERELTKADVLKFYGERAISAATAKDYLKQLGYDNKTVSMFLVRISMKNKRETRTEQKKLLETRFKKGIAPLEETIKDLQDAGYGSDEVTHWIDLWTAQSTKKTLLLSKTELKALLKKRR